MDVKEMEGWEGGMGRKERERCGEKRGDGGGEGGKGGERGGE